MQGYRGRKIEPELEEYLTGFPSVGVLGPRQCGKTTLALEIVRRSDNALYLDLEKPSDLRKLDDPELFLGMHTGKLVCIDEIQRKPDLFPVLRALIDEKRSNGRFLILGSASRDLIRQSSETLAGRIAYLELTPFLLSEIALPDRNASRGILPLWLRGGFPRSFLVRNEKASVVWRDQFVRTFLERDIPQLGFSIPAETLGRLWRMLAHNHGQILNSSRLGESIGVSHTTIRSYIDLLAQTFMIRVLPPFAANVKKRLVKSPKVFIRDTGILHSLLEIEDSDHLLGHPIYGASWEGFAMENILSEFSGWNGYFYSTAAGAEVDLVLTKGRKTIVCEFKASTAPQVKKGFWNVLNDLQPSEAWIIAPVKEAYPIKKNVTVAPLLTFLKTFTKQ